MEIKEALKYLQENQERKAGSRYIRIKDIAIQAIKESIQIHETHFLPPEEALFKKVEEALGFKLYVWQKAYILFGYYRRSGETTAKCIRELLVDSAPPIDFSTRPKNAKEDCYRRQFREIQNKLIHAGIPTRTVFWCISDKKRFERNQPQAIAHNGKNVTYSFLDESMQPITPSFKV